MRILKMVLENCPKCDQKLPSPFKSSGRQVCSKCGWSSSSNQTNSKSEPKKKLIKVVNFKLPVKLSKREVIIIGCLVTTSIIGILSRAAWANSKIYCLNEDEKIAHEVLEPYLKKWEDYTELAHSTSRMNLPPIIATLQGIKQDVDSQKWSECAKPTVNMLTMSMDSEIEGFIEFLDPDNLDYKVQNRMSSAGSYMDEFKKEYSHITSKQPRKFWHKYLAEINAKEFLDTIRFKQDIKDGNSGNYVKELKDLETPDSNMKQAAKKYAKDYKIIMKTDEDKLTLWALAKSRNLKSFVQIVYPGEFTNGEFSDYLMCETKEPAKSIDPPEFGEDPQCLNGTVKVDRLSWKGQI